MQGCPRAGVARIQRAAHWQGVEGIGPGRQRGEGETAVFGSALDGSAEISSQVIGQSDDTGQRNGRWVIGIFWFDDAADRRAVERDSQLDAGKRSAGGDGDFGFFELAAGEDYCPQIPAGGHRIQPDAVGTRLHIGHLERAGLFVEQASPARTPPAKQLMGEEDPCSLAAAARVAGRDLGWASRIGLGRVFPYQPARNRLARGEFEHQLFPLRFRYHYIGPGHQGIRPPLAS